VGHRAVEQHGEQRDHAEVGTVTAGVDERAQLSDEGDEVVIRDRPRTVREQGGQRGVGADDRPVHENPRPHHTSVLRQNLVHPVG
jgi:hypothetical protein